MTNIINVFLRFTQSNAYVERERRGHKCKYKFILSRRYIVLSLRIFHKFFPCPPLCNVIRRHCRLSVSRTKDANNFVSFNIILLGLLALIFPLFSWMWLNNQLHSGNRVRVFVRFKKYRRDRPNWMANLLHQKFNQWMIKFNLKNMWTNKLMHAAESNSIQNESTDLD